MVERKWRKGKPLALLVGMQINIAAMVNSIEISLKKKKNRNKTTSHPTTGQVYPEKTIIEKGTCTPVFIAALFTIARKWKQPRCPSTDEWIKKLWFIYTMEYYSAMKRNTFESLIMRWMNLEPIIQSEVSQKDKEHYSILTHIYGI